MSYLNKEIERLTITSIINNGDTYTSNFTIVENYGSIDTVIKASHGGILYFDFSNDSENIDYSTSYLFDNSTSNHINQKIVALYVRIRIYNNSGFNYTHLRCYSRSNFFYNKDNTLYSIGTGIPILSQPSSIRSIISNDNSISISQISDDINLSTSNTCKYGKLFLSSPQTIALTTTPVEVLLSNYTLALNTGQFQQDSNGRLKYIASNSIMVRASYGCCMYNATESGLNFYIYKSGLLITDSDCYTVNPTGWQGGSSYAACETLTVLNNNDYLSVFIKADRDITVPINSLYLMISYT
jgi:hypothetical protein